MFSFLRENAPNTINFEKKKNATINKNRARIASGCDIMLYLWKKILRKVC